RSRRSSPSPAKHSAVRGAAPLRRSMESPPPHGATTGASAGHFREPDARPWAQRSCALRAATVLCNMLLGALLYPRALRLAPGYSCMPQSGLLECLARLRLSWLASVAPNSLSFKIFITQ